MNWFRTLGPSLQGIALMIAAMSILTLMDSLAKLLMQRYDPLQVVWARYACHSLLVFIYFAPRLRTLLVTHNIWLQILRSAFLFGATILFFTSLAHIGLAEAAALFDINPLVITVLAFVFLKEPIGPRRIFGVAMGLAGALIIIRPGSGIFSGYAMLPLLAACCYSAYVVSTRFLGRNENLLTSLLYTALIGCIVASVLVVPLWQTPGVSDAALMLVLGGLGAIGQYFLIRAFTLAQAAVIAPFSYVGLVFAVLYGYLFFGEFPDAMTLLGALVIVASGLYVWHRERQSQNADG